MNIRLSLSWDGLFALREAIDLVTSRVSDTGTGQEKKGAHYFREIEEMKED